MTRQEQERLAFNCLPFLVAISRDDWLNEALPKNTHDTLIRLNDISLHVVVCYADEATELIVELLIATREHLEALAVVTQDVDIFFIALMMGLVQHLVWSLLYIGEVLVVSCFDPVTEAWNLEDFPWVCLVTFIFVASYPQQVLLQSL